MESIDKRNERTSRDHCDLVCWSRVKTVGGDTRTDRQDNGRVSVSLAVGLMSILGIVIDFGARGSALPICDSNSMNELSCRASVPKQSRSNPARGSIGCVPAVIGSTVGVCVERNTDHHATDPPC